MCSSFRFRAKWLCNQSQYFTGVIYSFYKRIQLCRVCDGYNDALWSLWYIVYAHHRYLWSTYISWICNALWALCRCIELSRQQTRKRCHWKPHFSSLRNAPTDTTGSKVIRTQLFYLSNIWSWLTYACQARSATDIQVYMDSSSCEQTGHHCRVKEYNIPLVEWFSAYRNRKAVQNALHIIYKECNIILFVIYEPSLLIAWWNAQCKRPPTEYWKRFTALG